MAKNKFPPSPADLEIGRANLVECMGDFLCSLMSSSWWTYCLPKKTIKLFERMQEANRLLRQMHVNRALPCFEDAVRRGDAKGNLTGLRVYLESNRQDPEFVSYVLHSAGAADLIKKLEK